jgi:hypothetical protein
MRKTTTGTNSDDEPGLTGGHENQGRCNQKQVEGINYGKMNQSMNKSKQEETCITGRGKGLGGGVVTRLEPRALQPETMSGQKKISDN